MKLGKYAICMAALAMVLGLGGCKTTDKISNNLGGTTRNNGAYNYDRTVGDNWNRNNGYGWNDYRGAGYWDYYGITDGDGRNTTNTDNTGRYVNPNTVTDNNYGKQSVYGIGGKATKDTNSKTKELDSAAIAG